MDFAKTEDIFALYVIVGASALYLGWQITRAADYMKDCREQLNEIVRLLRK